MAKLIYTATDVRNNFFNLISLVAKTKEPIFIKKDKEVIVKLEPVGDELNSDWEETKKILDAVEGMWSHRREEETTARFKEADEAATRKIRARKW